MDEVVGETNDMKIRFRTKDNLEAVIDTVEVEEPLTVIMRPMWKHVPTPQAPPTDYMEFRKYEFRGEVMYGIPTVNEV